MIHDLQKASMWKRLSAYLFDIILLAILAVGIALLLSALLGYDAYVEKLESYYVKYEEQYGVDFNISEEEYNKLEGEELENFNKAYKAFSTDNDMSHTYGMILSLTLVILVFSILTAYLVLEFTVPLLFKNGQTLGKKVFGVALMRVDGVKITPLLLFIRAILGKYTLETMVPVLIVVMLYFGIVGLTGAIVLGLLLLMQIVMMAATRTNSAIHDMLSSTIAVDMASQMIFDSKEAMLEYKKKLHADSVSKSDY